MTKNEKEYLDKTYDMFRKHYIETNNVEESWEKTKRLLYWYRIGLKDGASNQCKSEFQEPNNEEKLLWLARNKDGTLALWPVKPYRSGNVWWSTSCTKLCYLLDNESYPMVTWEGGPIEVKIVSK